MKRDILKWSILFGDKTHFTKPLWMIDFFFVIKFSASIDRFDPRRFIRGFLPWPAPSPANRSFSVPDPLHLPRYMGLYPMGKISTKMKKRAGKLISAFRLGFIQNAYIETTLS